MDGKPIKIWAGHAPTYGQVFVTTDFVLTGKEDIEAW
jgi:hypothetical protein